MDSDFDENWYVKSFFHKSRSGVEQLTLIKFHSFLNSEKATFFHCIKRDLFNKCYFLFYTEKWEISK